MHFSISIIQSYYLSMFLNFLIIFFLYADHPSHLFLFLLTAFGLKYLILASIMNDGM